jgi:hypothetical protein
LKIQDVLRHEKGLKSIKEPRWKKNPSQMLRLQKLDCPVLDTRVSESPKTDRVQVGFEI